MRGSIHLRQQAQHHAKGASCAHGFGVVREHETRGGPALVILRCGQAARIPMPGGSRISDGGTDRGGRLDDDGRSKSTARSARGIGGMGPKSTRPLTPCETRFMSTNDNQLSTSPGDHEQGRTRVVREPRADDRDDMSMKKGTSSAVVHWRGKLSAGTSQPPAVQRFTIVHSISLLRRSLVCGSGSGLQGVEQPDPHHATPRILQCSHRLDRHAHS